MSREVIIHSKPGCPFCDRAKEWFAGRNMPFTEQIHETQEARDRVYDEFGLEGAKRTMPQIILDGERIGGFNNLMLKGQSL